ncbi:DUF6318 family protein [Ornithinicoccus halotolerans]|uniref:DUF6318 family protein n=1 Tax=Ornithinicoccus halotolerans TaxID=1748220 RepID=UPI001885D15C|nr:DUF6318 family protein [Ornithinicoccus halotolerans]
MLLSACGGDEQPADPPEPEDALTATPTAAPTAAPDDESVTTEASETTSSPTDEGAAIPEMPEEAEENTEEGAEAFARHYIDVLNAASQDPSTPALDELAEPDCKTCANFNDSVTALAEQGHRTEGPIAEPVNAVTTLRDSTARSSIRIRQLGPAVINESGEVVRPSQDAKEVELVFRLQHDGSWKVTEILLDES